MDACLNARPFDQPSSDLKHLAPCGPYMPSAWVVLPTYNEAENVEELIRAVLAALDTAPVEGRVLVVDDDSPDGTADRAEALAAADPRIVVRRNGPKRGLGRAYLAGFRQALDAGADLLVEMDSDFSHDPADLPRLLAPVVAGDADVALGSRYVPGGSIDASLAKTFAEAYREAFG